MIAGPTASGKTELSLSISGDIFEIVSADSVQVYRFMDIGSNKPSVEELEKVKHYNISIVNPDYHFTAGDFCERSSSAYKEIFTKKKIPLLVGGTGFYIDSFLNGIDEIPDIDCSVRDKISIEYDAMGGEELFNELKKADPEFALKVHKNDKQRIVRGLSVYRATGIPISCYYGRSSKKDGELEVLFIGLYTDKEQLHRRIDARVEMMIKNGLLEEVYHLRSIGYHSELYSMKAIGYAEINNYIDKKINFDKAVEDIKKNTKKYAKKQLTWFKKNKNIKWFLPDEINKIRSLINNWLN